MDSNQIRHPQRALTYRGPDFGILSCGPMRVLFVISLIALAALLWAAVSIAQHIYRSRLDQKTAARTAKSRAMTASSPAAKPVATERPDQQRKAS
jgi:hypothetical protein